MYFRYIQGVEVGLEHRNKVTNSKIYGLIAQMVRAHA